MGFLRGKRVLIVGIASNRSIAYGVAQAMHREGAELALTYHTDKLKKRVDAAAEEFGCDIVLPLDVSDDDQITQMFAALGERWDGLDSIVHSVAFAPRDQLEGDYVEAVNREAFLTAHDISAYSFAALAKAGRPMMQGRHGSLITMSYLGAVRAMDSYNVMGVAKASLEANVRYMAAALGPDGIRVNAVSAGPIRTLASAAIANFHESLKMVAEQAPLRRNITLEEVGNASAYLCSDLASGITGQIVYVDAGYNIAGRAIK